MGLAPMPTKTLRMDAVYPQAVAEQWTTGQIAESADVNYGTAASYLKRKLVKSEKEIHKRVWKMTHGAGAIFGDASSRGLRRMEKLNQIPDEEWTKEEDRIEKHLVGVLKPLIEWCKLRMDADPNDQAAPAQLSDGL